MSAAAVVLVSSTTLGCSVVFGRDGDGGVVVANDSSSAIVVREFSFGDGAETT